MLSLCVGSVFIPVDELIQCTFAECQNPTTSTILYELRLPRILMAIAVGAALSVAGAILQNATSNSLADPYLFGVVAGAALGATLATMVVPDAQLALPIAAFAGAAFAVFLTVSVGAYLRQLHALILAGVAIAFMLSALTQFILFIGDPFAANRIMFWLMGSLARATYDQVVILFVVLAISLLILSLLGHKIDSLLLGDELAHSLGVRPVVLRLWLLAICAALTATVVAFCGGIGFVGLMIPHLVRTWFGTLTLPLMFGSAVIGGTFLILVDAFARSIIPGQEIPIGVITSLLGSLFFLLLLRR